jgi:hypothetical protein
VGIPCDRATLLACSDAAVGVGLWGIAAVLGERAACCVAPDGSGQLAVADRLELAWQLLRGPGEPERPIRAIHGALGAAGRPDLVLMWLAEGFLGTGRDVCGAELAVGAGELVSLSVFTVLK